MNRKTKASTFLGQSEHGGLSVEHQKQDSQGPKAWFHTALDAFFPAGMDKRPVCAGDMALLLGTRRILKSIVIRVKLKSSKSYWFIY